MVCLKLYQRHRSPSCKSTASGHLLNLSLCWGRENRNKGYSKTLTERGSPPQVQALCSSVGVVGWLEHIPGELARLSRGAAPQCPPAPPARADVLSSLQHKHSVKADSSHSRCCSFGAACREAAGCCHQPSHTRWQPVLPLGLFTLTPFATTKAENISYNFCLLFSAEESWFIFTATFNLEKRLPVCVMFLQW